MNRRHGFFVIDGVVGIAIMGALLAMLSVALSYQHRVSQSLSNARAAIRKAESALADAQAGRPVTQVQMRSVQGGNTPPGFAWVEATATDGSQTVRLVGLIPQTTGATP